MAKFDEETARLEGEVFKLRINFYRSQFQRYWLDGVLAVALAILAVIQPPVFAVLLTMPLIPLRFYFICRRGPNNLNRLRVKYYSRQIKEAKGLLHLHQEASTQNRPSDE